MAEAKKLGRYELRRVLGKGAMGVVYEGYDPTLSRRVAVKTILKSVAHDDETERDYAERFVREAKAVARLSHPHIIQVFDFGVENEVAYLVMEFIQGRELRDFFSAGESFGADECVRIMAELLDALGFAHEAGVIHRDVKPANVMLDAQRRVKLADFGVARVQDSDRSAGGTMVGTPAFMSPEQVQGRKVDRRTDLFSAGTILYQLLTGEQPFKGEGAWTVAKQIMQDDPPAPSSVVHSVSPAFDAIVDKALAKDPAQRYSSAGEFAAALRGAAGAQPPHGAAAAQPAAAPRPRAMPKASETELEFWRAIQNSTDAAEFEFYLEKFPEGTYAGLARHKMDLARQKQADARAKAAADDATVAIPVARRAPELPATEPPAPATRSFAIPAALAAVVIGGALAAYQFTGRAPAPAPVAAVAPAGPKVAPAPAVDAEKIRRETEERVRKEFADKAAAERAALEKAVAEKVAAERAAAERVTQARSAADRAVAEKAAAAAAAERLAAEKVAAAKAAERVAAEKAAAEKAAAEKAATEKAASERVAAEKSAAEKAAAEKLAAAKASSSNSVEAQLERFIQRKGRGKVLNQEPALGTGGVSALGDLAPGEVVYVNDGSCPPGRIREVTGTPMSPGANFRARPSRCISLAD